MSLLLQSMRFACVGVAATLVHLGTVAVLVPAGLPPARANIAAFLLAFQASYFGHRIWTFRREGSPRSYARMLLLACASFAFNQTAYLILIAHSRADYRLSLAVVLLVQAAITFFAARAWAFAATQTPTGD
ncbi:GtrA family protein [Luteolibacter sp. GHJ8]|uniref:GtrA family protein n=1 Tax=Luteolibacter rhizosphaerae TaxID=2989719 RepID=A0ABT3G7G1_9BACT|nr:GtrA family protein [Luteolibacter rhizosphaerae]MCW1915170.1 GtrA family protein [Luteolibacter rhizosphaerae]